MNRPAPDPTPAHGFNLRSQADRDWSERAGICAELLAPVLSRYPSPTLADVGCGDRKLHRKLAETGLDVAYSGFDLRPQGPEVAAFDVERDDLPGRFDVAALLGVTEYLVDLPGSLARLGRHCDWIVLSHVLRGSQPPSPQRLAELGWHNHLDRAGLVRCMADAGLEPVEERLTPDARTLVVLCTTAAQRARAASIIQPG
jgi:hypothetical protein